MEFNAELLEQIVLGRSCSEDIEPDAHSSVEVANAGRNEAVGFGVGAASGGRHEHSGKGSLRIHGSHVLESRSSTESSSTPRASALSSVIDKPSGTTTPRAPGTPRMNGSITPRGTAVSDDKSRKSRTLFDELCTKTGQDNAMKWFETHSIPYEREMSEAQFLQFIHSLTKFYDWEVYEIMDILDRRHTGTVEWEAFYILLALYTAYYSRRLTKFLYKYGFTVFNFLVDPVTKRLTFERFSRLGFLVGLSEDDMLESCQTFGFKKNVIEIMSQEDFLLCYFAMFNTIDTGVEISMQTSASGNPNTKGSVSSNSAVPRTALSVGSGLSGHSQQKCVIS